MNNNIEFTNCRIIYPDFLGTGKYNTYHQNRFNIIVTAEEAAAMGQSGLKIKYTKASQNFPEPEPYVEVGIGFSFMNKETGLPEPARNAPVIMLRDLSTGNNISITQENLDVLNACKLANVNITVSQSTPKINNVTGKLGSRFYLRSMTADVIPFYAQK